MDLNNVVVRVFQREAGVKRVRNWFSKVPQQLQLQIDDIIDSEGEIKSCVLLGFSRCGNFLMSYTTSPVAAADGLEGYCLQVWSFLNDSPCRKLWNIPLFRVDTSCADSEDNEGFDTCAVSGGLALTVAESADGSLLVVHGRQLDTEYMRGDRVVNYLTCTPGPKFAAESSAIQVVHLAFHTAPPHPPFNPFTSLSQWHSSVRCNNGREPSPKRSCTKHLISGATVTITHFRLGCNLGCGVRILHIEVSHSRPRHTPSPLTCTSFPSSRSDVDPGAHQGTAARQQHCMPKSIVKQERLQHLQQAAGDSDSGASPSSPKAQHCRLYSGLPTCLSYSLNDSHTTDAVAGHNDARAMAQTGVQLQFAAAHLTRSSPSSECQKRSRSERHVEAVGEDLGTDQLQEEMSLRYCTISRCPKPQPRANLFSAWQPPPSNLTMESTHKISFRSASTCAWSCGTQTGVFPIGCMVDWEEFLFSTMEQQGLLPSSLADYSVGLVTQGIWREQAGLLFLAVLLFKSEAHCKATLSFLVHISFDTGDAQLVEILACPYPWQQHFQERCFCHETAGVTLDYEAAFGAYWLRSRLSVPTAHRQALPYVLTNRSVINVGLSLKHIAHPWLPQCILGYGLGKQGTAGA